MEISAERKDIIDSLVEELHLGYNLNEFEDLKRAAEDRGIKVIQNNNVILPSAFYSNADKTWYITTRKPICKNFRKASFAHELGHSLLEHRYPFPESQMEDEAHYFQERLGYLNMPKLEAGIEILATLATKPIPSLRYLFSSSFQQDYDRDLLNRE